jgi:hypothetical protein
MISNNFQNFQSTAKLQMLTQILQQKFATISFAFSFGSLRKRVSYHKDAEESASKQQSLWHGQSSYMKWAQFHTFEIVEPR